MTLSSLRNFFNCIYAGRLSLSDVAWMNFRKVSHYALVIKGGAGEQIGLLVVFPLVSQEFMIALNTRES